jgi:hypothetical protein
MLGVQSEEMPAEGGTVVQHIGAAMACDAAEKFQQKPPLPPWNHSITRPGAAHLWRWLTSRTPPQPG